MYLPNQMTININGLGIILYSPGSLPPIGEGEDFLTRKYFEPSDVLRYIYDGTLICFATCSPGTYILQFHNQYPTCTESLASEFRMSLGICVEGNSIVFRDLYDLMQWSSMISQEQRIIVDNGYYHISLLGNMPVSGIIGNNQVIDVYINSVPEMPKLRFEGIPTFCE